jgi:hypothetical protein
VPAIFGDSHKEECAKKNATVEKPEKTAVSLIPVFFLILKQKEEAKPVVEKEVKKRKVEEDKKKEPSTKKGKKEEDTEKQDSEEDIDEAVNSALKVIFEMIFKSDFISKQVESTSAKTEKAGTCYSGSNR